MRKIAFLAIIAAIVVISLGCISAPPKKAENASAGQVPAVTTLRIGYQPSTHQIAEMAASELGWWAKDLKPFGVQNIEEKEFPSGPPEMQAMLAGDLDVAYVGTAPPITAIAAGLPAKIVAAANINGSDLVLRPGISYSGPKSLEGLGIATYPPGSIQDIVMKKWLTDNNVNISKIKIYPMGPGDAVTAIEAGKVSGVFLPHPYPSMIEMDKRGSTVVSSGEMWPNHACCSVLVSEKLIKDHPDLVEQIVKTHINATNYINANPEEAAKIFVKKVKGQNLTVAEASIKNWDGKWVSDPNLQVPSTIEYAKLDKTLGYINKTLTQDDIFDTSFYIKAKA